MTGFSRCAGRSRGLLRRRAGPDLVWVKSSAAGCRRRRVWRSSRCNGCAGADGPVCGAGTLSGNPICDGGRFSPALNEVASPAFAKRWMKAHPPAAEGFAGSCRRSGGIFRWWLTAVGGMFRSFSSPTLRRSLLSGRDGVRALNALSVSST